VTSAIIENIRFQDFTNARERDFVSVLEEFDSYSDVFDDEIISYSELNYKIDKLLKEHSEIQIIKHILSLKLNDFEVYFFLDTLWDAIKAGDNDFNTHLARTIDDFHKSKSMSLLVHKEIINGKTKLNTLKLIELSKENYKNHTRV